MHICGDRDTIAAIATPPGQGGIGVVRVSGPQAKEVLAKIWAGKVKVSEFESHRLYFGPVGSEGFFVDRALISWMKKPKSYTGEDVVEVSGHGGPVVMERILKACCDGGARLAQPGEFTKRAFLNGKIDLIQAEAVVDVISASNEEGMKNAQEQLAGRLSRTINKLNERLTELRAFVEASIDFPEEDIELIEHAGINQRLQTIIDEAARLSATFEEGRILRDGLKTVIAGKANVGKSSLFNALVGTSRAIVHPKPGTTRDVVEQTINIKGRAFHLRDTAGLGQAKCEVEGMGMSRAQEEMGNADVVIYVIDATIGMLNEDREAISTFSPRKVLVVYNKSDLLDCERGDKEKLFTSATIGRGLDKLKEKLVEMTHKGLSSEAGGVVITNLRHKSALDDSMRKMKNAAEEVAAKSPVEFVAHYLKAAQECLGNITGESFDEALLEEVFSRFCIGK